VYESYYGFLEKPFNLTPDPKYLYLSARHSEAFAHLEFGRRERGGFVVITGEVGTGKTTLARRFLGSLGEQTATAVVLYPALTAAELLRSILDDLHVEATGASLKDQVDALHQFLLKSRSEGRNVVLLIDEAQDLSAEVLEQIRLLSNLETDTEKLIQIVLMGQSELHEMLARRELRQLAQRVTARYHLSPLDRAETEEYIRHRLKVAGGEDKVAFSAGALAAVHRLSGGVPRLVNLICDRSLLAGYVAGTRAIDAAMVRQAAREVRGELPTGPAVRRYAAAGGGLGLAAVVALLWLRGAAPVPAGPTPTPAPAPSTVALEPVLLALERDASFRSAIGQVQALWRDDRLERTTLRTHVEQLRRLGLPAVLEMFHPARRDTCYLALLGMDGDTALIGTGSGTPLRVPFKDVDRLWTRQAMFLWKDVDSVASGNDPGRAAAWARNELQRLGYMSADPDLGAAVTHFQRDTQLNADGILGSRTLMALYALGPYPRPRLERSSS